MYISISWLFGRLKMVIANSTNGLVSIIVIVVLILPQIAAQVLSPTDSPGNIWFLNIFVHIFLNRYAFIHIKVLVSKISKLTLGCINLKFVSYTWKSSSYQAS